MNRESRRLNTMCLSLAESILPRTVQNIYAVNTEFMFLTSVYGFLRNQTFDLEKALVHIAAYFAQKNNCEEINSFGFVFTC